MNLSSLSKHELSRSLRSRQQSDDDGALKLDDLVQELQAQRAELETQNRALREAAEEMELAVQRYCDLYDHLPIGYVTLTHGGRIVEANLTAAGWLRRDRSALVGGSFAGFLDAFDAGRFAAHLESCIRTESEQAMDLTLRLKDGLLLAVQLTSRLAPPQRDAERQVHTAITNISKVSQVHAVLGDMKDDGEACSWSLANPGGPPATTVSKFARTVLREHEAGLGADVKNTIERMECAALRMEASFQELLDYCCLGHEDAALDPVNLEELVQQIVMEQRGAIQRHAAEILVQRPLPCVRGARLLLGQMLTSVLTNLLRTAGQSARIRIGAGLHNNEVVLQIADEQTPLHAPADEWSRDEKDSFWSGGVGLAVLQCTAGRMNGRLWVETGMGRNTCVNLALRPV